MPCFYVDIPRHAARGLPNAPDIRPNESTQEPWLNAASTFVPAHSGEPRPGRTRFPQNNQPIGRPLRVDPLPVGSIRIRFVLFSDLGRRVHNRLLRCMPTLTTPWSL